MKFIRDMFYGSSLLLFILLLSCAVFAQKDFPKIKPGKVYQQSGVTITSPNQPDWQIVKAGKLETIFLKTNAQTKFNAFVKTSKTDVYENISELFEYLENLKNAEISKLDRDSLHFNRMGFKKTPCLQYDGIFRETSNYKYFNMNGYLCRHPAAKDVLIQIEFSNYSNTRGFSESDTELSKDFFEKFTFSKILN